MLARVCSGAYFGIASSVRACTIAFFSARDARAEVCGKGAPLACAAAWPSGCSRSVCSSMMSSCRSDTVEWLPVRLPSAEVDNPRTGVVLLSADARAPSASD
eukprot:1493001-Pleurochrysis_carterae.AAC.4